MRKRLLRPGQRLIERELVEQLGVSRTTVRDVLARVRNVHSAEGGGRRRPDDGGGGRRLRDACLARGARGAPLRRTRLARRGRAAKGDDDAGTGGRGQGRQRGLTARQGRVLRGSARRSAQPQAHEHPHHAAGTGPAHARDLAVGRGPPTGGCRRDPRGSSKQSPGATPTRPRRRASNTSATRPLSGSSG